MSVGYSPRVPDSILEGFLLLRLPPPPVAVLRPGLLQQIFLTLPPQLVVQGILVARLFHQRERGLPELERPYRGEEEPRCQDVLRVEVPQVPVFGLQLRSFIRAVVVVVALILLHVGLSVLGGSEEVVLLVTQEQAGEVGPGQPDPGPRVTYVEVRERGGLLEPLVVVVRPAQGRRVQLVDDLLVQEPLELRRPPEHLPEP